ncbi:hypothetical protein GC176_02680 [bacterium]|nr:hypothetical protein [bacterium]
MMIDLRLSPTDRSHHARRRGQGPRQGTVLIICVVCLLLLSLTAGVLIRAAMLHRNQTRLLLPQAQAEWLAEAAAQVAAARLQENAAWSGDTWTISMDQTGLDESARIAIQIAADTDVATRRVAQITIDSPPDAPHRAHIERAVVIDVSSSSQ